MNMGDVNREFTEHMLAIVRAFKDLGPTSIQYYEKKYARPCNEPNWQAIGPAHRFQFEDYVYRLKPEPRVIYLRETEDGCVVGISRHEKDRQGGVRTVKYVEVIE